MPIDFNLPPDVEEVRQRVRVFMDEKVRPVEEKLRQEDADRGAYIQAIIGLRGKAREAEIWNPHLPPEWGGMGLGPVGMAFVSAEAGRTTIGPFVINAQAPDEGNMHTLLHWGTPEQKEKYLRPLAEGLCRSCFAMTEPEVAGSDPTLPDDGCEGRRRVGLERPQVVRDGRPRCQVRRRHRLHRSRR